MAITCIIVDDEPIAQKGMEEYISKINFLKLAGKADDAAEANNLLTHQPIDLMYLDIQMPDVTGIDYLKTIKNPPVIIFTTAYPQFALTAFELDAVDYLIKPISFERFLKATNKAKELVDLRNLKDSNMLVKGKDHFYIKSDKKIVRVNFDEILFVEGMAHHLIIHTGNKKYITYLTFKALDDFLPKDKFIKTHKSYLIALSKIENIEADEITISGKTLPISRSYKEDIMKLIDDRFLRR